MQRTRDGRASGSHDSLGSLQLLRVVAVILGEVLWTVLIRANQVRKTTDEASRGVYEVLAKLETSRDSPTDATARLTGLVIGHGLESLDLLVWTQAIDETATLLAFGVHQLAIGVLVVQLQEALADAGNERSAKELLGLAVHRVVDFLEDIGLDVVRKVCGDDEVLQRFVIHPYDTGLNASLGILILDGSCDWDEGVRDAGYVLLSLRTVILDHTPSNVFLLLGCQSRLCATVEGIQYGLVLRLDGTV